METIFLQVAMAFGIAVSDTRVACACSGGVVKLFTLKNLGYLAQLPFPDDRQPSTLLLVPKSPVSTPVCAVKPINGSGNHY